jgi:hypothetical protein
MSEYWKCPSCGHENWEETCDLPDQESFKVECHECGFEVHCEREITVEFSYSYKHHSLDMETDLIYDDNRKWIETPPELVEPDAYEMAQKLAKEAVQ